MPFALLTPDLSSIQKYPLTKSMVRKFAHVGSDLVRMTSTATDITTISPRIIEIQVTARPPEDETKNIREIAPVKNGGGVWVQTWEEVALDAGEQTQKMNSRKKGLMKQVMRKGEALRKGTFEVGPGEFDLSGDGFSRIVLMGVETGARTVPIGANAQGIERYFDATAAQVASLVTSISNFIDSTYANESILRDSIAAASTIAELNAVDINAGCRVIRKGSSMEASTLEAVIGLGGVIYASTVGYLYTLYRSKRKQHDEELRQAAKDTEKHRQAFEFIQQCKNPFVRLNEWQPIADQIELLCNNTEIDRVLLLVAINGERTPTHATAIWDYRQDKKVFSYVDVPLDRYYVELLLTSVRKNAVEISTAKVQNTLIGNFYNQEGVREAIWTSIGKRANPLTQQVAYKYLSFATHSEEEISSEARRIILNITAMMKAVVHTSGFKPI